jgi:hypothetical protein
MQRAIRFTAAALLASVAGMGIGSIPASAAPAIAVAEVPPPGPLPPEISAPIDIVQCQIELRTPPFVPRSYACWMVLHDAGRAAWEYVQPPEVH